MKLPTATVVASVAIIFSASTAGLVMTELDSREKEIASLQTSLQTSNNKTQLDLKIRTEVVSSWIMNHSSRISDATAKYIAVEAFKYPHPILLLSLVEVESEFNPTAVSKVGAVGLSQIMYDIHKKDMVTLGIHKKRDLFDIDKNIKATSSILQMMLRKSNNDIEKALHFYLGGKDGKYVNRIFSNYVHLSLEIERNDMPKM